MSSEIPLTKLLEQLDQLTETDFQNKAAEPLLREQHVPVDDLADFANFWAGGYARNRIHRTELYELLLLAWLPGQRTQIHDHGGKLAWTKIVHGRLEFKEYAPFQDEHRVPEATGVATIPAPGDTVVSDDRLGMHSISNPGPQHALSLHLYAGPLDRCRVWNGKHFEWKTPPVFTTPEGWREPASSPSDWSDEELPPQ